MAKKSDDQKLINALEGLSDVILQHTKLLMMIHGTEKDVGDAKLPSKVAEEIADKEEPVKKPKPVDTSVKKPVVKEPPKKKEEEPPAPVIAGKPKVTYSALRLAVLKWIGPLAKGNEDDQEKAQDIMMKMLDKYTGGKPFTVENVPEKYYQNILDYINTVEVK